MSDTSTSIGDTSAETGLDDPEDDYSDSVMVALLPITTDWCNIDLPHLTLVYAGEIKDLKPADFNDISKDVASLAMLSSPITLQVTGTEIFGDEGQKVDVLTLRATSALLAMRNFVEDWNASEYPFTPHCTIGDPGSLKGMMPSYLAFDRIMVQWGKDALTFWLKQGGSSLY